MNRKIALIAGTVVAGIALAACGTSTTGSVSGGGSQPPAAAAQESTPPPAPPVANPQAKYSATADYTIPSDIYGAVYVTGETDVINTGNVGIVVKCRMGWQQLGLPDITATKKAHVPFGATVPIRYHVNVGSFSGNGGTVIDAIQSYQSGHMDQAYGNARCKIVDTFGSTH
jgi:hypothetical protein